MTVICNCPECEPVSVREQLIAAAVLGSGAATVIIAIAAVILW
jgi:hypothetical protein